MPVSPARPSGVLIESHVPTDNATQPDSSLPASTQNPATQKPGSKTSAPANHAARRNTVLGNIARAGRKGTPGPTEARTGTVFNAGLSLACELVHASMPSSDGMNESAGFPLHELEEMIRPLAPTKGSKPPPVAVFIADAITRLKDGASPEQNAEFIQALENLKPEEGDINALGFYAVMAVMAAAVGIADAIRNPKEDEASLSVNRLVKDVFPNHITSLLESASAEQSPLTKKLAAITKLAMTVAFEYEHLRMYMSSLSRSMMEWIRSTEGKAAEASQKQLNSALRRFIDARTGKGGGPL